MTDEPHPLSGQLQVGDLIVGPHMWLEMCWRAETAEAALADLRAPPSGSPARAFATAEDLAALRCGIESGSHFSGVQVEPLVDEIEWLRAMLSQAQSTEARARANLPTDTGKLVEELRQYREVAEKATPGNWMRSGCRSKVDGRDNHGILAGPQEEIIASIWYNPKTHEGFSDAVFVSTFDPPTIIRLLNLLTSKDEDNNRLTLKIEDLRAYCEAYETRSDRLEVLLSILAACAERGVVDLVDQTIARREAERAASVHFDGRQSAEALTLTLRTENERLKDALNDASYGLQVAVMVAKHAAKEWDEAPNGMKAGKLLIALSGGLPGYRSDIDQLHAARQTARAALSGLVGEVQGEDPGLSGGREAGHGALPMPTEPPRPTGAERFANILRGKLARGEPIDLEAIERISWVVDHREEPTEADREWARSHATALPQTPLSDGWQDISTAPKDGTKVDLWVQWPEHASIRRVADAFFDVNADDWKLGQYRVGQFMYPPTVTHWRPLPDPPQHSDGGEI